MDDGADYRQQQELEEQELEEEIFNLEKGNSMAFIAKKTEADYAPPPEGMHVARCYRLIDLGTQEKFYQGVKTGEAQKILISFELLGEERMNDGSPFSVSKSYFLSMHEKSNLRKDLESWRGRQFTHDEESSFDVSKLLGAYCLLNMVREPSSNGKEYTNIKAITPLIKGMPKPEPVNKNTLFDLDNPDLGSFDGFSEKIKEIIQLSKEWKKFMIASGKSMNNKPDPGMAENPQSLGTGFDDMEDDIPF